MSLFIDLIDLVAKHKSGELRCPATALILLFIMKVLPTHIYTNTYMQQGLGTINVLRKIPKIQLDFSYLKICILHAVKQLRMINKPVHEKTNNLDFRPGLTQIGLYSHRIKQDA